MKTNKFNILIKIILILLITNFSNTFKTTFTTKFKTSSGLFKFPIKNSKLKKDNLNLFQLKETKLNTDNINNKDQNKGIYYNYKNENENDSIKEEEINMQKNQKLNTINIIVDKIKYAEGWIKYFTYDENGKYKPKRFFLNEKYDMETRITDTNKFPKPDEVKKIIIINKDYNNNNNKN